VKHLAKAQEIPPPQLLYAQVDNTPRPELDGAESDRRGHQQRRQANRRCNSVNQRPRRFQGGDESRAAPPGPMLRLVT